MTVKWPRYSKVMDYELEIGVVTRCTRSTFPPKRRARIFSATRSSTTFPRAIARGSNAGDALAPRRARALTARTRSGPGSSRGRTRRSPDPERRGSGQRRDARQGRHEGEGCFRSTRSSPTRRRTRRSTPAGFGPARSAIVADWRLGAFSTARYDRTSRRSDRGSDQHGRAPRTGVNRAKSSWRKQRWSVAWSIFPCPFRMTSPQTRRDSALKIEYTDHRQSRQILTFFPGLQKEDLPEGQGWAVERVQLSTHNGTHLDAPWHYHPTMNEGQPPGRSTRFRLNGASSAVSSSTSGISPTATWRPPPMSKANSSGSGTHCSPSTSSSSTPARGRPVAVPIMWRAAAVWEPRRRSICSSAACVLRH